MLGKIWLDRKFFTESRYVIVESGAFVVTLFRFPSGVEAVEIANSRGKVVALPYMGQMIWDLSFDGLDLKMKNMFAQPKPAACVVDTYGCFAFHSGLLANGCPAPEDAHPLHGEMPCAVMDRAWLEIGEDRVRLMGESEYVRGFGHHYLASPSVSLGAGRTWITIGMRVKNLASVPMPLQYMCHMNYAYVERGVMTGNLPETAFQLRETVPAHVRPTKQWLVFHEEIKALQKAGKAFCHLDRPEMYDPEIVFMADHIDQFGKEAVFEMTSPAGYAFFTKFSTADFSHATRWLLYNGDQQVAAFVLPATCRPEGFLAAEKAGTLLWLDAGAEKRFSVTTGKKSGGDGK